MLILQCQSPNKRCVCLSVCLCVCVSECQCVCVSVSVSVSVLGRGGGGGGGGGCNLTINASSLIVQISEARVLFHDFVMSSLGLYYCLVLLPWFYDTGCPKASECALCRLPASLEGSKSTGQRLWNSLPSSGLGELLAFVGGQTCVWRQVLVIFNTFIRTSYTLTIHQYKFSHVPMPSLPTTSREIGFGSSCLFQNVTEVSPMIEIQQ